MSPMLSFFGGGRRFRGFSLSEDSNVVSTKSKEYQSCSSYQRVYLKDGLYLPSTCANVPNMQNPARRHVLADVRLKCELTQAGLAELLDIHTMSIQKIEQGVLAMSAKMATRIGEVLDLDPNWLLANNPTAPPVTQTGIPWLREHYELARMSTTTWGLLVQKGPSPKSKENTARLAKMKQLYRTWQEEELTARIAAILAGADSAGGDGPSEPPRGAMFGVALQQLKEALDDLEARFPPDWKTLEARQERIDRSRVPYLELVEKLKEEAKAQLSPKPKSKSGAQRK
jgi:DNA-binding XRE family transcriptional regulator